MDDLDWEQHCREFDELAREHHDLPLPDQVLADHHRLSTARMDACRAELARLMAANPHIDWRL